MHCARFKANIKKLLQDATNIVMQFVIVNYLKYNADARE